MPSEHTVGVAHRVSEGFNRFYQEMMYRSRSNLAKTSLLVME